MFTSIQSIERCDPEIWEAINKESIQADFDAINKSMIKINLNNVTESEGN